MGFKLLRLICKVGRFVASAPSSVQAKHESTCQKCYIVLVFIALCFGLLMTIINNNFYLNDIQMKMLVSYLTEFNLFAFSVYTILVINFWKRGTWCQLMEHLLVIKKRTQKSATKNKKRPYYLGFVLIHVVYIFAEVYISYSWSIPHGWKSYFKKFNVRLIQLYLQMFQKLLIYAILSTLLVRYKRINVLLTSKISRNISIVFLRRNVKTLCRLKKTIDIFVELYGLPIALIVLFTTFEMLNYILFALYYEGNISFANNIFLAVLRLAPTIVGTSTILVMCDSISDESNKIRSLMYEISCMAENLTTKEEQELFELIEYVEENVPIFSAAGYFIIGKATILNIAATVVNFLIVVLQVTNKI
ncbi:hypothetical protein Zmor_026653 [Zophobas morio]|uniref:Gustatory receptor n=1 Tax=Zophobas morio TaxID=2755281 RepID=A0AA38M5P0_9CUCU|nr:hypothetical protein Zmor_026653 [Zophobas morio]